MPLTRLKGVPAGRSKLTRKRNRSKKPPSPRVQASPLKSTWLLPRNRTRKHPPRQALPAWSRLRTKLRRVFGRRSKGSFGAAHERGEPLVEGGAQRLHSRPVMAPILRRCEEKICGIPTAEKVTTAFVGRDSHGGGKGSRIGFRKPVVGTLHLRVA